MKDTAPRSLHLITASDLHLLSHHLNDRGESLHHTSLKGDGKVLPFSAEIITAFIQQVLTEAPDALVLTGDLTFNGERQSHLDLIEQLRGVEAAGIRVAVIPGNHDIAMDFAASFSGGNAWKTDTISWDDFTELYREFSYDTSAHRDSASFSHVLELAPDLWLILIDVNTKEHPGAVSEMTLAWLDGVLAEAAARGITLFTATHQSILIHNEKFTAGFIIKNHSELEERLTRAGVRFNLSGHIHLQHLTLQPGGLSEAATGSLAASPHPLAHLRISPDRILDYATDTVDVAAWAKRSGLTDPELLDFAAFSRQYFFGINASKTGAQIMAQTELDRETIIGMAEFAAQVNTAYFEGTLVDFLSHPREHPGYSLWEEHGQALGFWHYLNSFLMEPFKNETRVTIDLGH